MLAVQGLAFIVPTGMSRRATSANETRADEPRNSRSAALLRAAIDLASRFFRNWRDLAILGEIDDQQLRDIGVVRSDLERVARMSTSDAACRELQRVARRRGAGASAAAT